MQILRTSRKGVLLVSTSLSVMLALSPVPALSQSEANSIVVAQNDCPPDQNCENNADVNVKGMPAPKPDQQRQAPANAQGGQQGRPAGQNAQGRPPKPGQNAEQRRQQRQQRQDARQRQRENAAQRQRQNAQQPPQNRPAQNARPQQPANENDNPDQNVQGTPKQPAQNQPANANPNRRNQQPAANQGNRQQQQPRQNQPARNPPQQPADETNRDQNVQGTPKPPRGQNQPANANNRRTQQPAAAEGNQRPQRRQPNAQRTEGQPPANRRQQPPRNAQNPDVQVDGQRRQPPRQADRPARARERAADVDTTVEQQLEAQGDVQEAQRVRRLRDDLAAQLGAAAVGAAVGAWGATVDGESRQERRGYHFYGDRSVDGRIIHERDGRIIYERNGRHYSRSVVPEEGGRFLYGAEDVEVQNLPRGRTRTIVYRRNGAQIITIRNRHGEVIQRSRRTPDGREFVLFDSRFDGDGDVRDRRPRRHYRAPTVSIPQDHYIVDLGQASPQRIRQTLLAPPVDRIEQPVALDDVLHNADLRAYAPRIDLDTITFPFGSATIGRGQMAGLVELGRAMEDVLADNPDEVYLIEGHTDAVGSDYDNLILSDRRAEAVAVALSQNFNIPPENLVTEGYGEQFLKVPTEEPERRNRRATVRRLTQLLSQNQ